MKILEQSIRDQIEKKDLFSQLFLSMIQNRVLRIIKYIPPRTHIFSLYFKNTATMRAEKKGPPFRTALEKLFLNYIFNKKKESINAFLKD
ncbi:hypothetical protein BpHYR1_014636 [Brachionus plicatilis]|uniref:Uncharacterized protein n=1 Tax=Brachionus plicatilis TaxID=10195 RepID=A0A3M7T7J8_BRAPC|nr:hypothetical protein BpHYR1_014636 [Brachionus plicatilis]